MTGRAESGPSHLPGLDLLRALAVIWVMLFHSFLVGGLGPDFEWLQRFGWAGVDMFFVLSGFLIGSQVLQPLRQGQGLSIRAFYARRAWRILPSFAAVLLIYAAFPGWREVPGLAPLWQFATFTVNLLIDYEHTPAFSHAWSLCVEEHFYLLFPWLALWLTRRPSAARFALLCATVLLGGIALRAAIWLHGEAADPSRAWFIETLYYPTWTRLDGLLVGVMLATLRVWRPATWARWQASAGGFLLAGLLLVATALSLFADRTGLAANTVGWPLLSIGLGALVVDASAPATLSWLGRWRVPGAAWVAAMSYSLYLSHKLVFHAMAGAMADQPQIQGGALFAVYALATLAAGAALHCAVERPFLRWRDASLGSAVSKLRA